MKESREFKHPPNENNLNECKSIWDQIWIRELKDKSPLFYGFYDEAALLIEENFDVSDKTLVLEPGCGSGRLSLVLAQKGANVVLLDVSEQALNLAKELFSSTNTYEKANLVLGDIRYLPFRDGCFDVTFNEGVIEHFIGDERQIVVNEMARVTKRGGKISVLVPNAWNFPYAIYKKLYEKRHGTWSWGLEVPYTPKELKQRFFKAGIKVLRTGGCRLIPIPYHLQCFPARLVRSLASPVKKVLGRKWLRMNTGYTVLHRNLAQYLFCVGVRG